MDTLKTIGSWVLLIAGLGLICWTLFYSYSIFTGNEQAPEFFQISAEDKVSVGEPTTVEEQMEQLIGEQLKGLIPANSIPALMNLVVWSILALILINGGAQIAGIGTKLMRK